MGRPRKKCCKTCDGWQMCQPVANCCVECHMAYEEEHCGPYLPPELLEELRAYHREIKAGGFDPDATRRHAVWEEQIFAQYVPREILAQVEIDHWAEYVGEMRTKGRVTA